MADPDEVDEVDGTDDDESTVATVPVKDWIPHPVSDSSDYLDGDPPLYGSELTGSDKEDFESALSERKKRLDGHTPRRNGGSRTSSSK